MREASVQLLLFNNFGTGKTFLKMVTDQSARGNMFPKKCSFVAGMHEIIIFYTNQSISVNCYSFNNPDLPKHGRTRSTSLATLTGVTSTSPLTQMFYTTTSMGLSLMTCSYSHKRHCTQPRVVITNTADLFSTLCVFLDSSFLNL